MGNNPANSGDFVFIQGGVTPAGAPTTATVNAATAAIGGGRFCGRFLNTAAAGAATDATVCTGRRPFQLGVFTDGIEAAASTGSMASMNELADGTAGTPGTLAGPLGTIGFQLVFQQIGC